MAMKKKRRFGHLKYLLYVAPAIAIWFVLAVYPNVSIYPISLYKWNGLPWGKMTWVGLKNFQNFLSNPSYRILIPRTLLYIGALIAIQTPLALFISYVVFTNKRLKGFLSGFFFFPVILSTIAVSLTWKYMYDPNLGAFNEILKLVGLERLRTNWLELDIAPVFAVLIHVWHKIGYPITIFLAGLTSMPDSLYDAADVDGVSGAQRFAYITLPLLMPTVLRIVLLTIITGGLAFDYSFLLGPISSNVFVSKVDTLAVWLYRGGLQGNMGWPAAVGTMLSVVFMAVYVAYHFVSKRTEQNLS
jgi:raffinose/stachyose/melibiose transport system permease protein